MKTIALNQTILLLQAQHLILARSILVAQHFQAAHLADQLVWGYGFSVSKDFLITLGADYSPLTANTGSKSGFCDEDGCATDKFKVSNRYNIFIAPGYVIDKNKLAYFKAGYSAQTVKGNGDVATAIGNPSKNLSGYVLGLGYKQIVSGWLLWIC
jgi:outer membrane immunogenic protein